MIRTLLTADEENRQHYAKLYARPGNMRAAFAQFRSIHQDAKDNEATMSKKLSMPVLVVGGENPSAPMKQS